MMYLERIIFKMEASDEYDKLKLWKIDYSVTDLDNLKKEYFPKKIEVKEAKNIHIIVQVPATTGKNSVEFDEKNTILSAIKTLSNKRDNKPIDLEVENVVLNGASVRFADIILVRENGTKYLDIQCKWDYGSKNMTEGNVEDDVENLNNLISNGKDMYDDYELITIIFTT
ncbi:hypothetical protein GLOIN_2v1720020 [Rhizophagus clarus]|uniref:Uncharacterized protein n=1 Tax=Rhizophagus clarus TaxID=94130 RepID=A0A8H3LZQ1_9GLOM|nr:hypothetical protein GLOIN_2v1720020 [Rhizophagus clarus]